MKVIPRRTMWAQSRLHRKVTDDKMSYLVLPSLPPGSVQEATAQSHGVPGRDPYPFMEQV